MRRPSHGHQHGLFTGAERRAVGRHVLDARDLVLIVSDPQGRVALAHDVAALEERLLVAELAMLRAGEDRPVLGLLELLALLRPRLLPTSRARGYLARGQDLVPVHGIGAPELPPDLLDPGPHGRLVFQVLDGHRLVLALDQVLGRRIRVPEAARRAGGAAVEVVTDPLTPAAVREVLAVRV